MPDVFKIMILGAGIAAAFVVELPKFMGNFMCIGLIEEPTLNAFVAVFFFCKFFDLQIIETIKIPAQIRWRPF